MMRFDFHLLKGVRPGGGEGVVEDVGEIREVFVCKTGTRTTERVRVREEKEREEEGEVRSQGW